jgi:hypothetical protein
LELTLSKYAAAAASALLQSHDLSGLSHSARIIARVDLIINVNLFMMGGGLGLLLLLLLPLLLPPLLPPHQPPLHRPPSDSVDHSERKHHTPLSIHLHTITADDT